MVELGNDRRFRDALAKAQSEGLSFSKKLGFELSASDDKVLMRLSRKCCFLPRMLGAKVAALWEKRSRTAKSFSSTAKKMLRIVADFKKAEAEIETRFQCFSLRPVSSVEVPSAAECILNLGRLEILLDKLMPALSGVEEIYKPQIADEQNYYVYLMATFLRWRCGQMEALGKRSKRATGEHYHGVVASYIKSWESADRKLCKLTTGAIGDRVAEFKKGYRDFSTLIDNNLLMYVKEETGVNLRPDAEK